MFLVYESLYEELARECGESTSIIGLYDSKEKAFKKAQELIDIDVKENNFVLDIERDNLQEDNYVRLFWNNQENWSCYCEICIEEIGVE